MALLSPSASSTPLDTMSSTDLQFLKMEDLHSTASPSPAPTAAADTPFAQSSPAPVVVQSRPAKKRKSWGQELPEPKTTLPPRKRAKTDDEKEQRRIERIKRNRAAAHNSRERKRQETEHLAVQLAKAKAELEAYKNLHGPLPASIVLPEVYLSTDGDESVVVTTPVPSLVESHGSDHDAPSPTSPRDDLAQHLPTIKEEPLDHAFNVNCISPAFDSLDSKSTVALPLDLTHQSAVLMCDLQCRSSSSTNSSTSASWWSSLIAYTLVSQLQTPSPLLTLYRTLLVAFWTISPSRMARLMQASTLRSSPLTNSSTTPRRSLAAYRRLARHHAATGLSAPPPSRSSLDEAPTTGTTGGARHAPTHQTQALSDHGTAGNRAMDNDGDENGALELPLD